MSTARTTRKPKFKVGQVIARKQGAGVGRIIELPSPTNGNAYGMECEYHTWDAPESELRPLTKREKGTR